MSGYSTRLVLIGLGAALVLLPLGLGLPGLPMTLRADETSHYFLARSLAYDGDAVADAVDIDRIYREMPYAGRERLAVGSDDGWTTARWAVSPLYSVLLVPAVLVARTSGAFAFNALCFVLALALLGRALMRTSDPDKASVAWVVAGAALFLSGAFVYVWWIHPASLRLLLMASAFALGWPTKVDPARYSSLKSGLQRAAAGACLGLCAAEVPWLVVLLPALLARHRGSMRRTAALLAGAAAGVGVGLFTSWLVLGHLDPDALGDRAIYEVTSPDVLPWLASEGADDEHAIAPLLDDGLRPEPGPRTTARRLLISLVGRRRGLLVLFPFAALFAALFFGGARGRTESNTAGRGSIDLPARLVLAAGLAALVLSRPFTTASALDLERFGDPVLTAAWPAFFFLPAALPGVPALLAAVAASALLLTTSIFTPFGPPVASGDAHHGSRGWSALPLALEEVSESSGWDVYRLGGPADEGLRLWAPDYVTREEGTAVALLGGERVDLWLEALKPVAGLHVEARSFAPNNRLSIEFESGSQNHGLPGSPGSDQITPDQTTFRLPLEGGWHRAHRTDGTEVWITSLVVSTATGERPQWRAGLPISYYVGALLTVLGSDDHVSSDVFDVQWAACGAPPTAKVGEELRVLVRLRNTSDSAWITDGPVSVRLAHRWRSADGKVVESPHRTHLDGPVPAGEETLAWVVAETPAQPGPWQLEIEPVYELVAWFSDRMDDPDSAVCRTDLRVEP